MKKLVILSVLMLITDVCYSQINRFYQQPPQYVPGTIERPLPIGAIIELVEARRRMYNENVAKIDALIQYIFNSKSQTNDTYFLNKMDVYYKNLKSLYDYDDLPAMGKRIREIQFAVQEEVDRYNQRIKEETERQKVREEEREKNQEMERKKMQEEARKTGTGFALSSNGYIITNHHVIDKAKSIEIQGINGDFTKKLSAEVVVSDERNDLAIIKINDPIFNSLGTIPYTFRQGIAAVGENIFVLGFPMTDTMGDEIKLTNGIVSSKTGFQGNISTYQISAPIQPGNSGGPLFDKNGQLLGVVNAKHTLAENAGYAIKTSYVRNLIELLPQRITLPQTNLLYGKTLTEQVKLASNFTYLIVVNSKTNYASSNSSSLRDDSRYGGSFKAATVIIPASLREYPDVSSKEIYKLSNGVTVYVIDDSNERYCKVTINGYIGYLSKAFLKEY